LKKAAYLVKISNPGLVREKLPNWTDDDIDRIIASVQNSQEWRITTQNCEACKQDLEIDAASQVVIK
jgi:hypothetical protein